MSVTRPAGFTAAGVPAGLKSTGAQDLALVVNTGPSSASASACSSVPSGSAISGRTTWRNDRGRPAASARASSVETTS